MKVRNPISLISVALWLMAINLYSQNGSSSELQTISPRNSIAFFFTLHKFPDTSPIIQFRHIGLRYWSNINFGLEYERRLNKRQSLTLQGNIISIHYFLDGKYPQSSGMVASRTGGVLEVDYNYTIHASHRFSVSAFGGMNMRAMYETYIRSFSFSEQLGIATNLYDWGISAGMKGRYFISHHFSFPFSLRFTKFLGNNDEVIAWAAPMIIKPTMSYLKLQFGISFDF